MASMNSGKSNISGTVAPLELSHLFDVTVSGRISGLEPADFNHLRVLAVRGRHQVRLGTVDASGNYRIRGLGLGVWKVLALLALDGRQAVGRLALAAGMDQASFDLDFASGRTLAGRIAVDGRPLGGAHVAVAGELACLATVTDQEGRFAVHGLEAGPYWVDVSAPDLEPSHQQWLEIVSDHELVIELHGADPASGSRRHLVCNAARRY